MRPRVLGLICALCLLPSAHVIVAQVRGSRTESSPGVERTVLIDRRSVQAVRVTYASGVIEPPGPHPYDVVLVPLSPGPMKVVVAGLPQRWTVGDAIFIPRGVAHEVVNVSTDSVRYISIRIP